MFAHFEAAKNLPDPETAFVFAPERPGGVGGGGNNLFQFPRSVAARSSLRLRVLSPARSVIPANHQTLAGKIGMRDFREVPFVKQGELQAVVLDQFLNLRGAAGQ